MSHDEFDNELKLAVTRLIVDLTCLAGNLLGRAAPFDEAAQAAGLRFTRASLTLVEDFRAQDGSDSLTLNFNELHASVQAMLNSLD